MPASKAIPFVDSTAINLDWTGTIKSEGPRSFIRTGRPALRIRVMPLSPRWQSSRETAQESQESVIAAFPPSIMLSKFDFLKSCLSQRKERGIGWIADRLFSSLRKERGTQAKGGCRTFELWRWQFFLFYPRSFPLWCNFYLFLIQRRNFFLFSHHLQRSLHEIIPKRF